MPNATAPSIAIPENVRDFCTAHSLLSDLELAVRLADEAFAPVRRWKLSLQDDPEVEGETYVIIDVTLNADVPEAMRRDDVFTQKWVRHPVTPEGKWRIRVLPNFS